MKPGQVLTKWWQDYVMGGLRTPQDIHAASRAERPDNTEDRFTSDPVERATWDVPLRLAAPHFLTSQVYAQQQQRADWQHAPAHLQRWAAMLVMAAHKRGIPLFVHCCYRGEVEQNRLRKEGVSKRAFPKGAHNIAEAVDIVHGTYGWNLTPKEWAYIHTLGQDCLRRLNASLTKDKKLHLNWGGNDGTPSDTFRWDPAHWEISDYRLRSKALPMGLPVHKSPALILRLGR